MADPHVTIHALTYDQTSQTTHDWRGAVMPANDQAPMLDRSIANDLVMMAKQPERYNPRLPRAIAAAIDEALLALVEE